jgi:hypothetical protein
MAMNELFAASFPLAPMRCKKKEEFMIDHDPGNREWLDQVATG